MAWCRRRREPNPCHRETRLITGDYPIASVQPLTNWCCRSTFCAAQLGCFDPSQTAKTISAGPVATPLAPGDCAGLLSRTLASLFRGCYMSAKLREKSCLFPCKPRIHDFQVRGSTLTAL